MGETEEVVLTAGKRDGKAVIRLERKPTANIDSSKVHHVAGGPYKGILINKSSNILENVEPSAGRLEFMAHLINQEQEDETVQDFWVLQFWFRGNLDGVTKKKTFTQYFQDLMNPTNFPKNYIGFMKKALVLLKSYPTIKRVELQVEQVTDFTPEEIPPIKSFTSLFTPAIYQYSFIPEVSINSKTFITFMLKASADAHFALSATYGDLSEKTIEIVIGAEGNTKSMIRDGVEGKIKAEAITMKILSPNELRYFWINWENHRVEVGSGAHYGYGRFLDWKVPSNKQFSVHSLAVTTDNTSTGQFEFAELLDVDIEYSRKAKKAKVQKQLIWIAKTQKILQFLEDAYPNFLSVSDLLRQTKVKSADSVLLVNMLRDMERKCLVQEVDSGYWMRMQKQTNEGTGHEVKLVKDMPQLMAKEQPTIAIITSLYCEKLAVDAMIDDKTTFVKYKTENESQVYTIGTIGLFRVVSTKLSRMVTSHQTATVSLENTVTRLLGTFSQVEHVFLVGVAGGLPHYTDFSKHVRLGDIVVSMATDKNSPTYIHCQKVETIYNGQGYGYNTRPFGCNNRTLQNTVASLRSITEYDWLKARPWDTYIEQGSKLLSSQEYSTQRPGNDLLPYRNPDGTTVFVEHPKPAGRKARGYQEGRPNVHYGVIGCGKLVSRTDDLRRDFAEMHCVKAYEVDFESVLESLEGNRNESFLVIRGICDYADGSKKEWQGYASLVAASYMKSVIMAM